ncbi:glycosyltransferase [Paenibacillus sp.]|uniref:glycosyltransferase n=1 Tax=Paenibacillus sp. TaxID=58172 RepID=UPI002D5E7FB1|nr:glycosyltransferase [Paenibacillus sp.]HZG84930.1 glycosyltransferase [Paenibacillus sp.]
MKVLLVHNYYQQPGGEDKVVAQELEMLRTNGVVANLYSVHNNKIKNESSFKKVLTGIETIWSPSEYSNIKKVIMDLKPDVVHVHNFFPLISPSIYYLCKQMGIPVVQTLHNYRLLCPGATFLREGKVCEECLQGSVFNSIKYGCYRKSRTQTISVASMIQFNKMLGTWSQKVNKYIALTEFAKNKFVEGGLPGHLISVKPNFIKPVNSDLLNPYPGTTYLLYVGRISAEKGVENLLKAWKLFDLRGSLQLVIVGEGPDKEYLEKKYASDNVIFAGSQGRDSVLQHMAHAKYLIVPSVWYEGFPMTIVESYSVGTPVICSKIGSLAEIVKEEKTGFQFIHDDLQSLIGTLKKALSYEKYEELRVNVSKVFNTRYTEKVNFEAIMNIYHEALQENRYAKAR